MSDFNDNYDVGYGKPPKHTRFAKGQSGNPKGRPRGAKNLSTIIHQVGRELIRVNVNGRLRSMSKFEANVHQLMNRALKSDPKAIREVFYLAKVFPEPEQNSPDVPVQDAKDKPVMASILKRLRQIAEPETT